MTKQVLDRLFFSCASVLPLKIFKLDMKNLSDALKTTENTTSI